MCHHPAIQDEFRDAWHRLESTFIMAPSETFTAEQSALSKRFEDRFTYGDGELELDPGSDGDAAKTNKDDKDNK